MKTTSYNAEKEIIQQQNNVLQEVHKKEKTIEEYKVKEKKMIS